MASPGPSDGGSKALPVPQSSSFSSHSPRGRDLEDTPSRATTTARLASPIAGIERSVSPSSSQRRDSGSRIDLSLDDALAGPGPSSIGTGPGASALAAAFQGSLGTPPVRYGTPPRSPFPPPKNTDSVPVSNFGSFDTRSPTGNNGFLPPTGHENLEIVKKHLVQPSDANGGSDQDLTDSKLNSEHPFAIRGEGSESQASVVVAPGLDEDEFSSLQLQGGDVTRHIYRWTEEMEAQQARGRLQRSRSFKLTRPAPESETTDMHSIKVPGGFRRDFLRREAENSSPTPSGRSNMNGNGYGSINGQLAPRQPPQILTSNFIEFLSLFGHFAGEELVEDDEDLMPDEYFAPRDFAEQDDGYYEAGEGSALLGGPETPGLKRRQRRDRGPKGTNGPSGAALLLLKSFVGTGVLFLPKAFLNGGMVFSNVVLLLVAILSFYCFILLVNTRLKIAGSFGDIGGALYGKHMRRLILFSIVLSQIGFASAYIVFTSENLQAFVLAVSHCRTYIDIKYIILMQLIIFLPLSLWRDISKLGATALVADVLILLGLIYLYYYDIFTLSTSGIADVVNFNPKDWTLFIGTAIFTFEGIGLIIPIQESMKKQEQFPTVLGAIMVIITVVFLSMGALSYAAFGSQTRTVVILNLPQDNKFVNAVQFMYSLAILLSTPLQLFPAIRILENELFTKSGKYNPYIKWQKNLFRFFLVMLTSLLAWGGAGDLDKFVALIGSFACVPLVYVYPVCTHRLSYGKHLPSLFFNQAWNSN
jgi:proton-coupled amino acid transporter